MMNKHSFPPALNAALAVFEDALAPLLMDRHIETVFQPIVSIRRGKVIALEALSRFPNATDHVTSSLTMFQKAQDSGLCSELDLVCIHAALYKFSTHHRLHPNTLLSLNVHASTLLDKQISALGCLVALSGEYSVPHSNIVVELLESGAAVSETSPLRQVMQQFKNQGFLVALDDLG